MCHNGRRTAYTRGLMSMNGWRGRGDESGLVSRLRHSVSLSPFLSLSFSLSRITHAIPNVCDPFVFRGYLRYLLFCARFLRGTDDDARRDAFTNHRLFFLPTTNEGRGLLECRRHSEGYFFFDGVCIPWGCTGWSFFISRRK